MATGNINKLTVGGANIWIGINVESSTLNKIGNITVGAITPNNTYVEHFISDKGARRKDKEVAITKGINVSFTFDEIDGTNLDRFVLGSANSATSLKQISYVLSRSFVECRAIIDFKTNVGKSFRYVIPKANLKADGGLPLTAEDWMSANMTLECLHHSSYYPGDKRLGSTLAPFGFLHLTGLHASLNATYF